MCDFEGCATDPNRSINSSSQEKALKSLPSHILPAPLKIKMCWLQPFCCILMACLAIWMLYGPFCDLWAALFGDGDDDDCDPSPKSWSSCCVQNEVISSQLRSMRGGARGCMANLASIYIGASIACTRDTQPYRHPQGASSSDDTNLPELVIEPGIVTIGRNWHFVGEEGALVIRLFHPAHISGFTVIHPCKCEIPPGYEKSAPREFYVMGMNDLEECRPFHFGNFSYNIEGESSQTFPVQACSRDPYSLIEFRFLTNHGNPNYTAIYKIQIHGDVGPPAYQKFQC